MGLLDSLELSGKVQTFKEVFKKTSLSQWCIPMLCGHPKRGKHWFSEISFYNDDCGSNDSLYI
jgi:hypothetical protein